MAKPQSCRSCVYWDKPRNKAALAGKHYPCTAPIPDRINLPDSVLEGWDFRQTIKHRGHMERDHGQKCATWAATIPKAPQ